MGGLTSTAGDFAVQGADHGSGARTDYRPSRIADILNFERRICPSFCNTDVRLILPIGGDEATPSHLDVGWQSARG